MKQRASLLPTVAVLLIGLVVLPATAADVRHEIAFPDVSGFETIACDLHMHTVFSDGNVWPGVRVDEAWRQGLDALAITDHVEYQPHRNDLPTNHNRPYELASGSAKAHGLLMPRGAEITRDTPPGHFNAIFLDDVDPLDTPEFLDAIEAANQQGAFVFWNHHAWKGTERGRWLDVHTTMLDNKWLHGMEVCNGDSYYPNAHQWCLDRNLTMLGNSDIHAPDLNTQSTPEKHRTLTLAFVKEKTLEGLKDALQQGRTVVWFEGQLIGRKEWLGPLADACVKVETPHLRSSKEVWVRVRNTGAVDLVLDRTGQTGPSSLTLPAGTTSLLKIETETPQAPITLEYAATNLLIAPKTPLPMTLKIP